MMQEATDKPIMSWPCAYGGPLFSGVLRQRPEDFVVEEVLGFEPAGEGEHVFLWLEKTGINTGQLAEQIARLAQVAIRQVSFSGMKDRHAITRQWFSVHLPGKPELDWQQLNNDQVTVLAVSRHLRKLRRGVHRGNRFVIGVSELAAEDYAAAAAALQDRIALLCQAGSPNYFGEQRFGHGGMNLLKARQWFRGEFTPKRFQRGLYLSAARSWLFNEVLAQRVEQHSWSRLTSGELLMLEGSHSVFRQADQSGLDERLQAADIHLTGPLYGKPGTLGVEAAAAALETEVLSAQPLLLSGLEQQGLKAERRALRVMPQDLSYQLSTDYLQLAFTLPSGCFATALIRELIEYPLGSGG